MVAGQGGAAAWALRLLPHLQLQSGDSEGSIVSSQAAIRAEPERAELWEVLGAAYRQAGRQTSALKVRVGGAECAGLGSRCVGGGAEWLCWAQRVGDSR